MITLRKGKSVRNVPRSAVEHYIANGWEREEEIPNEKTKAETVTDTKTEDAEEIPDEKAIEAMSVEQLRALAAKYGVDISDCSFKRDIKQRIKETLL